MHQIRLFLFLLQICSLCGADTELVNSQTPWRAYVVVGPKIEKDVGNLVWKGGKGGKNVPFDPATIDPVASGFARLPDPAWIKPEGDVTSWSRYTSNDLMDFLGDYGVMRYYWDNAQNERHYPALLCLRSSFGIADPAKASDLKVTVTCLGGAVIFINGREVGRGYMPKGQIFPLTPADTLPPAAYVLEDGVSPLPDLTLRTKPEAKLLPRYQQRIRSFSVDIPKEFLVKGANTIAVELHQSAICPPVPNLRAKPWVHLGVHAITLTSASGAGTIAYSDALQGTRIWSAIPEEQIADTPTPISLVRRDEGRPVLWMRGRALRGIQSANPFDPVQTIKIAAPRNGVGSGQSIVTDLAGVTGLKATISPLKGPAGEIPAGAVEIRYAVQTPAMHFCDALLPSPPENAKTVPIWIKVEVPKNQAPGWYSGVLKVKANAKDFAVPVQVLVSGAVLPDPRDFTSIIGAACSPEVIAAYYKVAPWSDEHLKLMEPSLHLAGQLGNDVVQVPVILGSMSPAARDWTSGGSKTGPRRLTLIRWVKNGDTLKPDFRLLEKYLDVYVKHCGAPKALSLYVWDSGCSTERANAYENRRKDSETVEVYSPLLVHQWDPKTGELTEMPAPNFIEPGAEAFWKPVFEGVRALVVKRGWSERIIMAGLGGDLRPGEKTGEILRHWVPYLRWNILSHFSGDPMPMNGKMIATGKLEVGLKEYPYHSTPTRALTALEIEQDLTSQRDFLDLPTQRWLWQDDSAPMVFRTTPMLIGVLGHMGLDFWPEVTRGRQYPQNTSFFTASNSMTVPGANGAEPTVRYQMMREGVQDVEVRNLLVRSYLKLPEEQRKPYRDVLDEFVKRVQWSAGYFPQFEIAYGWRDYIAQVQEAAANASGVTSDATWRKSP